MHLISNLKNIFKNRIEKLSPNFVIFCVIAVIVLASSSAVLVKNLKNTNKQQGHILGNSLFSPSLTASPTPNPSQSPTPVLTASPISKGKTTPTPSPKAPTTPNPTQTSTVSSTPAPQSQSNNSNVPVISSMNASNSNFGQYVNYTIAGNNFGSSQGTAIVFDSSGNNAGNINITGWQNSSIQANIVGPAGTAYSLEITTPDGKKSNRYFFTQPLGQPYFTPDSISPKGAKPGETVTISGDRFDNSNGKVTFDGAEGTIVSWSNTEIKVTIPTGIPAGKEVAMFVISSKGQQSSLHYYILGN